MSELAPEARVALVRLRIAAQGAAIASSDHYTRALAVALDRVAETLLPTTNDKEGTRDE